MLTMGGWVQMVPHQPTVIRLGLSGLPQLSQHRRLRVQQGEPFHT